MVARLVEAVLARKPGYRLNIQARRVGTVAISSGSSKHAKTRSINKTT